jgi:hypothetical protein
MMNTFKDFFMNRGSTWFLRGTILFLGFIVLMIGIFFVPSLGPGWAVEIPQLPGIGYMIMVGIYACAIPFYMALYQAMKLLNYIDRNKAFSDRSVKALKHIKYCGIAIGVLCAAGMPIVYYLAEMDDAPGLVLFGMVFVIAPIAVAVLAAVLQRLLRNAINIKNENDLTV